MGTVILSLANELLVHIFLRLQLRDLLRCTQVCRRFCDVIQESLALQYKIECAVNGMVDGDATAFSLSDRYNRLLEYRDNWIAGTPTDTSSFTVTYGPGQYGTFQSFGCVLACFTDESTIHMIQPPSKSLNISGRDWILRDLPGTYVAHGIDHHQQLLIIVDILEGNVHVLESETGLSHPLAHCPLIKTTKGGSVKVEISGDFFGLITYVFQPNPSKSQRTLQVWNWKTSEQQLEISDLVCSAFAFADDRHVILPWPALDPDDPMLKAKLFLIAYNGGMPLLLPDVAKADGTVALDLKSQAWTIDLASDRGRGPPHDARTPFMYDPESRLLKLSVRLSRNSLETFFIPMRAFQPFTTDGRYQTPTASVASSENLSAGCPTDWNNWARSVITSTGRSDIAHILGTRVLNYQAYRLPRNNQLRGTFAHVSIIDLNPLLTRRNPTLKWNIAKFDAPEGLDVRELDNCFGSADYLKYGWTLHDSLTPLVLVDSGFAYEKYLPDREQSQVEIHTF